MLKNSNITIAIQKPRSNAFNQAVKNSIYKLDLAVWNFLKNLACQQPELAACQFQITPETVEQLAQANEEKLHELASGVLFSFQLCAPEEEIIGFLKNPYDSNLQQISPTNAELYGTYWFAISSIAASDVDIACLCFGISQELAKTMAQAAAIQISRLANIIPLQFSLRCSEQSVLDCLSNNNIANAFIEKQITILKNTWHDRIR